MRLNLKQKTTLYFVAFGLFPAVIVAIFAWLSTQELKRTQRSLLRQAAVDAALLVERALSRNSDGVPTWDVGTPQKKKDVERNLSYVADDQLKKNYLIDD